MAEISEIQSLISSYGGNCNSFITLYEGFEYFKARIAYVNTGSAWVGAAEPFCAPEEQARILEGFASAAAREGKSALLIPVRQPLAQAAASVGYETILVGSEPTFDLRRYPRTGKTWLDIVPTAKSLYAKGARVFEWEIARMTPEKRAELDSVSREWLSTRKMAQLGFLNKVEPWTFSEHKKYFSVEMDGRVLGFLAAIPVWARKGWYLVDLMRRQGSPAGSIELLLLRSMKLLREAGAEEATLGLAPLSFLERAESTPLAHFESHRKLYSTLRWVYEKGGLFYNFKSLHLFKMKFEPTSADPLFLVYKNPNHSRSPELKLRAVYGLSQAFYPQGAIIAIAGGLVRLARRLSLEDWVKAQLVPSIVVRSAPKTMRRLAYRCKLTLALVALALVLGRFADLPGLVLFGGGLEYLSGTSMIALCFLVPGALSAVLLRSIWLRAFFVSGIFGSGGALGCFLKAGRWFLGALVAAALWAALSKGALHGNWVALFPLISLFLGYAISRVRLKS